MGTIQKNKIMLKNTPIIKSPIKLSKPKALLMLLKNTSSVNVVKSATVFRAVAVRALAVSGVAARMLLQCCCYTVGASAVYAE